MITTMVTMMIRFDHSPLSLSLSHPGRRTTGQGTSTEARPNKVGYDLSRAAPVPSRPEIEAKRGAWDGYWMGRETRRVGQRSRREGEGKGRGMGLGQAVRESLGRIFALFLFACAARSVCGLPRLSEKREGRGRRSRAVRFDRWLWACLPIEKTPVFLLALSP